MIMAIMVISSCHLEKRIKISSYEIGWINGEQIAKTLRNICIALFNHK